MVPRMYFWGSRLGRTRPDVGGQVRYFRSFLAKIPVRTGEVNTLFHFCVVLHCFLALLHL